jgi:hypothetical protein
MSESIPSTVTNTPILLVAGDVCVDWLCFEKAPVTSEYSLTSSPKGGWRDEKQVFIPAVHGGAWILERFVRMMLPPDQANDVYTYARHKHAQLRAGDSQHVVHQLTTLQQYPANVNGLGAKSVYRASPGSYRFFGPSDDSMQIHPILLPSDDGTDRSELLEKLAQQAASTLHSRIESSDGIAVHTRAVFDSAKMFPKERKRIVAIFDRGNGFNQYRNRFYDSTAKEIKEDLMPSWHYLFLV